MNTLGAAYRIELYGGPQDGCRLEAEVPFGKKVIAPARPWLQEPGCPTAICCIAEKPSTAAEYWLERAEYRVENELPQLVFHYRFRAECATNRTPRIRTSSETWGTHLWNCIRRQSARFGRWLLTPVDYPFDVCRIGR